RVFVAIPSPVGPLPVKKPFDELISATVGDLQPGQEIQSISLLRRTTPGASLHHRNTFFLVSVRLRFGLELLVKEGLQPVIEDLITDWVPAICLQGLADIGQRSQDPVCA